MGTSLALEIEAPTRDVGLAASEKAVRVIEAVEARLSTWREDSELSLVNRQPVGRPLSISTDLSSWLTRARSWSERTDGSFEPSVGALVDLWGLRTGGVEAAPTDVALAAALASVGRARWSLAEEHVTRLAEGTRFEEGAFGKGAALDLAAKAAREAGATTVAIDLGGQWIFEGRPATCAVAHPLDRSRPFVTLERPTGSFSTTGNSERGISVAGKRLGHVLDPKTGRPARDWGSLTVWAPSAFDADVLSTALYVMGPEAAVRWAADEPDVEVLCLEVVESANPERRVRVHASSAFRGAIPSVPSAR